MRVDALDARALRRRLRGPGLRLRTGPVLNCIRSPLEAVARGIELHYAAHAVEDKAFADFHVSVERPAGPRRWWRPQVVFKLDGESPFTPLPGDQGFPILEWGLNWCITGLYHRFLTLHAAVLERGGRALVLPAPSGSGKSTLCAALALSGWRLLSDELALIDPATGLIHPLPRPVSLKNASIDVIRRFAPAARFGPPVHETSKGTVVHMAPPAEGVARAGEPARPGWIVLPRYAAGQPAQLQPLPKAQALMQLIENAFNYNVHGLAGFDALSELVDRSGCHRFSYARLEEAVAVFDALAAEARAA
ncbi:HprK-related kinase A [Azohydromonas caseinilytica]|uniref:HprK-related kinase A n=1 Tax=Azohydromonas caseinilytica TaxID=2728836 RepID=A0A848FBC8_9BURK|nr:HprK-related kinase A [Azohydromonas caseinilytica]NML15623.1 HprK-related kinase A [Azohydromonas caseinilytica]